MRIITLCMLIIGFIVPLSFVFADESSFFTEVNIITHDVEHLAESNVGPLEMYLALGTEYPVWSPDGRMLAFTGSQGVGIWTVPIEGGKPTLVYDNSHAGEWKGEATSFQGSMITLGFTSDGREIIFSDHSLGENEIIEFEIDGQPAVRSGAPTIKGVNTVNGEIRTIVTGAMGGELSKNGRYCAFSKMDKDKLHITYYWKSLDMVDEDYTIFVHFLNESGQIIFQHDHQPVDGLYPTSK